MSRRVSFWGGLSLSLLMLGGCLLADVGIDPQIDEDVDRAIAGIQGSAGAGGSSGPSDAAGGSSGSASTPPVGSGGSEGTPPVQPPVAATGGSAGMSGAAGGASLPPNGGSGGSASSVVDDEASLSLAELATLKCPDTTLLEVACGKYCTAYKQACGNFGQAEGGPYDYTSEVECGTFCSATSQWALGTISTPDSVMCRCYHSVLAMRMGQTPHCFHAARTPTMAGGCQPMP
jgi:hypothetical protein